MDRIDKLERENRRLKRIGLAAVIGASLLLMGQAKSSRTVEAESFVLKDQQGHTRATLGMWLDAPTLHLYDATGNKMVVLFAGEDGAGLSLNPGSQKEGIGLSAMTGGAKLYVEDSQGFSIVLGNNLFVRPKTGEARQTSAASVIMSDKNGHILWSAP